MKHQHKRQIVNTPNWTKSPMHVFKSIPVFLAAPQKNTNLISNFDFIETIHVQLSFEYSWGILFAWFELNFCAHSFQWIVDIDVCQLQGLNETSLDMQMHLYFWQSNQFNLMHLKIFNQTIPVSLLAIS